MATNNFISKDNSVNITFPDTIKVEEKKAPTDESIRLLNEFQEKARQNIIAQIEVADNTLNGVSVAYVDNVMNDAISIFLKFTLNNKEYNIKKTVRREGIQKEQVNYELKKYVQNELQAAIATVVLRHIQEDVLKQLKVIE